MAESKTRTPMAIALLKDLVALIKIPNIQTRSLIQAYVEVDVSIAQLKMFFEDYHQDKEYEKPPDFEKKVSFWHRFCNYILSDEIDDKPEDMSEEDFLLNMKFEEYSDSAKGKVLSVSSGYHSWSISVLTGESAGEYVVFNASF